MGIVAWIEDTLKAEGDGDLEAGEVSTTDCAYKFVRAQMGLATTFPFYQVGSGVSG